MVPDAPTENQTEEINALKKELRLLNKRLAKFTYLFMQLEQLGFPEPIGPSGRALNGINQQLYNFSDADGILHQRKLAEFIVSSVLMLTCHYITSMSKEDFSKLKLGADGVLEKINVSSNPVHDSIVFYLSCMEIKARSSLTGLYVDFLGDANNIQCQ